ncbi:hypothetical protein TIFTF001_013180 [Ficus carica]|uniref:Uncharacterized protein n=1 Tax=Ficus carica TaxID=3494 RepID=A0AA87ZUH5_FICCA|nr:hypothetical protein TIFTF001_013180 [Ficus carica]
MDGDEQEILQLRFSGTGEDFLYDTDVSLSRCRMQRRVVSFSDGGVSLSPGFGDVIWARELSVLKLQWGRR